MTRLLFALTGIVAITVATASAHHSYSAYHLDRLVEVEGVIDEFKWIAPHSMLTIRSDGGDLFVFEWLSPFGMERAGINRETLRQGERIVATGNPHREFERNRILNFKSVRRLADGWKWPDR